MKHLKRSVKKKTTQKLSLHLETWESNCEDLEQKDNQSFYSNT